MSIDCSKGPSQNQGPSPNRGTSLPDFKAVGADQMTKAQWQQSRGIDRSAQVKITKLSHMRYQHPNLAEITIFLKGMNLVVSSQLQLTKCRLWHACHRAN